MLRHSLYLSLLLLVSFINGYTQRHKLPPPPLGSPYFRMTSDDERMDILRELADQQRPVLTNADWTPHTPIMDIQNLCVETEDDGQTILNDVSLKIYKGQKHAIMGRNGSGKSTLTKVIAGHPAYKVVSGDIFYKGVDLLKLPVDLRAKSGIFLAFQYPVEIPIIKNSEFLRVALNEQRAHKNLTEIEPLEFSMLMYEQLKKVGLSEEFIDRPLNYGFSGGEKKRNEILQMLLLQPELCLLDETDSGLDVDSFKLTAEAVKSYGTKDKSFMIVTHYKKLLDLLEPDFIHIMHKGKIIKTGGVEIASTLEEFGFAPFLEDDE